MWRLWSMIFFLSLAASLPTINHPVLGQAPVGIVKLLSFSSYIGIADYFHVVGEIENGSPSVIKFVQVIGTFYDANNKVVGTSYTYTKPPDIAPGSKAPFDLVLLSASVPMRQITNFTVPATYQ